MSEPYQPSELEQLAERVARVFNDAHEWLDELAQEAARVDPIRRADTEGGTACGDD